MANLLPRIRDSPACETDSSEELAILRDAVRLALRVFVNLAQEKSEAVAQHCRQNSVLKFLCGKPA